MKIRFIILLPFLLASLAGAQTQTNSQPVASPLVAKLDAQYGFRDLKFEQSIESCPGMTVLEEDHDFKYYARNGDSLELGGAKLKSIEYEFYKGKLSTVVIVSEAAPNGATLLKMFEQEYGPAHKSPHDQNKNYWFGQKVTVSCVVNATGQADLRLWSKPMQDLRAADAKAGR